MAIIQAATNGAATGLLLLVLFARRASAMATVIDGQCDGRNSLLQNKIFWLDEKAADFDAIVMRIFARVLRCTVDHVLWHLIVRNASNACVPRRYSFSRIESIRCGSTLAGTRALGDIDMLD